MFVIFDCTTGTIWISYYIFGKMMLFQGTTIGSQSNIINLAVSITYKIVRGVSTIFKDLLKDSKDIASLQA